MLYRSVTDSHRKASLIRVGLRRIALLPRISSAHSQDPEAPLA